MTSNRDRRIEEEEFWNDDADARQNLRRLLGDDGYQILLEAYGGLRLFVPAKPDKSALTDAITIQYAAILSRALPGAYVRVPLDRPFLVARYRHFGFSNRKIAQLLRIGEGSVDKIVAKLGAE